MAHEEAQKRASVDIDKDMIKIKAQKVQGTSPFRINKNILYEQSSIIQSDEHVLHIP